MRLSIFILFTLLSMISCTDSDDDTICYVFDERQCAGDPWIEMSQSLSESEKISAVKEYLSNQNITVEVVSIDNDFHTIVCEACYVCPQGPRYEVSILSSDSTRMNSLMLLNLELSNCSSN